MDQKELRAALERLEARDTCRRLERDGRMTVATGGSTMVILDVELTEELLEKGRAREAARASLGGRV